MHLGRNLVAALGCLMVAVPLMAQTPMQEPSTALPKVNPSEGTMVGPFLFSPNLDLIWESRDNIFFTADHKVSDDVYLARARMMFELPIYNSYIRLSYTPQYRDYRTYNLQHNWSHFVTLDGDFNFSNGLKLKTTYRYVSGNLETREVDPGGELVYGGSQFNKHDFKALASYWFTPTNGLSLLGEYTKINYDNPSAFYDYSRGIAGVGWIHQISEALNFGLNYRYERFNAEETARYRDSSSNEVTVSLDGQVSPVVASRVEVGYRTTTFDDAPGKPHMDDYNGLVARGSVSWTLAHGSTLVFDVVRMDYPSNYDRNAYYTATGGGLVYRVERDRLFGYLRYSYQTNDYNVPDTLTGRDRSDDITTFGAGVGYHLTNLLSLRGSFVHQNRNSFHIYSYDANMFLVGLMVGF